MPFRVLVIFGSIPLLGQERANLEVLRRLRNEGVEARFVTHARHGGLYVQPALDAAGFKWCVAPFGPLLGRNLLGPDLVRALRGVLGTSRELLRQVRRWRPTHLYVANWDYFLYSLPALARLRLPLVYRLGDDPVTHRWVHRRLWRYALRRVSLFVCNCDHVRRQLEQLGADAARLRTIYGVPPMRPANAEPFNVPRPSDRKVVAYVGQILELKGVALLVAAFRRLYAEGRSLELWIAGDCSSRSPLAERLRAELERDGLGNAVRFLGHVEDVPGMLARADLHVCPSIGSEQAPNVILEAKQAGLPTVAFRIGGIPELIEHDVDGHLCAEISEAALAGALRRYLDRPELLRSHGRRAADSLPVRFGVDRFRREWLAALADTAAGGE